MVTGRQKERFREALEYVTNDGTAATFRPLDAERVRLQYGNLVRKHETSAFLEFLVEENVDPYIITRTKVIFEEMDNEDRKER
jgi:hypothetical protein